jgi:catechol 2,3-dioxygenase-like lactoylglutathione lyase family enzyme
VGAPALTARLEVAVVVADLDRSCRFYVDVLGLTWRLTRPSQLTGVTRHAVLSCHRDLGVVHVLERPGYDPVAEGTGTTPGHRGRVDHVNLCVGSRAELDAVVERLVAAGASTGEVLDRGPVLLCAFVDPDGTPLHVTCRNEAFDPASTPACVLRADDWFDHIRPPVPDD